MENDELTVMESKLLHKVVSLEQNIAELKSQLNQEREEKLAAQEKHCELDYKGFQMGKELTELIEQLTIDLLKEDGDGQDDGNGDMEVLRRNIPKALRSLKENIQRLDFDKDVLKDLKKMVDILILRRKSEEPAANQPEVVAVDVQSTPIVKTLRILEYSSELEEEPQTSSCESAIVYPKPSPPPEVISIQPPMVPPTKVESNAVFVEEIDTSGVIPRIISTYSVQPEIRGQFTACESNNEQRDDDGGDNGIPSTSMAPRSKSRRPFMARKRTGGFVPRISSLEEHALVPVRKSRRITKPTPKMQEQILTEELNPKLILKKITHEIHPVLNVTRNASEPASEKAPQVSRLNKMTAAEPSKKDKQHYLVVTPNGFTGFHCACGTKYNGKHSLNAHVRIVTRDPKFKCHLCQKRYFWYGELTRDLKKIHNTILGPEKSLYGCSFCGEIFSSNKQLSQHQISAHSSLLNVN